MSSLFNTPEEVEAAFYAAFTSADIDTMKQLWMDSDQAVCIHPMSPPLYGSTAILESWSNILANGGGKISHRNLYSRQEGSLAIHGIEERLLLPQGVEAVMHATHVYVLDRNNSWKLLVHHASPTPQSETEKPKSSLH